MGSSGDQHQLCDKLNTEMCKCKCKSASVAHSDYA